MADIPLRVLILLDGDHVAPEKSYLSAKAQGGALIAFQMAEQCRRWISREVGRDASISCLLFADIAHLCRSMDLPTEGVIAFSKGFSSTPTPCAFVHVLKGTTLAAISAHLAFLFPSLDYLFLGGLGTDVHAYHLNKLLKKVDRSSHRCKIILLETSEPAVESISKLAHGKTRFQGIAEVEHQRVENILTAPHYEIEDGHPEASFNSSPTSPRANPSAAIHNIAPPSPRTMARLAVLPESSPHANPWNDSPARTPPRAQSQPSVTLQPSTYDRRASSGSVGTSVSSSRIGPTLPPGLFQPVPLVPENGQGYSLDAITLGQSIANPPFPPGAYPTLSSTPQPTQPSLPPLTLNTTTPVASPVRSPPRIDSPASSTSTNVKPTPVSASAISPSTPLSAPAPSTPLVVPDPAPSAPSPSVPPQPQPQRAGPSIPERFLPLLQLIHSHQNASPISPTSSTSPTTRITGTTAGGGGGIESVLWSTIGSEISTKKEKEKKSTSSFSTSGTPAFVLPKGLKLKDFLSEAQREGWVLIGKGDGEGKEWAKLSKRAERALAKVGLSSGSGGK
ncbi:hypothetical protein JCM5350_005355 [Sporobolomyces pararoseus]